MNQIIRGSNFNTDDVKYSTVKVLDHGGKAVYIQYAGKSSKLYVQTEKMYMPFGVSVFDSDRGPKYTMELSFNEMDEENKMKKFYNNMELLDKKIVNDAEQNCLAWFGKKLSREILEEFYSPIIRRSINKETGEPDGKYPPRIKVKLPYFNGKFSCKFWNESKEEIDLTESPIDTLLTKGSKAQVLLQCVGLWFTKSGFGCSWKAVQVKVEQNQSFDEYCFIDDEEYNQVSLLDDEEEENNTEQDNTVVDEL